MLKKIVFEKNIFDAIICLDADIPDPSFFHELRDLPVFAADGAGVRLNKLDIEPDYIVGDLDTFDKSRLAGKNISSTVIRMPDQETNDFEKTLKFAQSKQNETLLIVGIHGGVLEHTLNNWSVFMRYAKMMDLCIYDKGRYGIPAFDSISMDLKQNEIISLIPQPKAVLTTHGLKWELNNENIELGYREGARNIAINGEVNIEIHSGSLLIFIDSRLPYAPGV